MCHLSQGAVIYLLDLFCNSPNPNVRSRTAELFSKMMSDKLIGPRVKIILSKFLPSIFMDAMRDNPEASVQMFEGSLSFDTGTAALIFWLFSCKRYKITVFRQILKISINHGTYFPNAVTWIECKVIAEYCQSLSGQLVKNVEERWQLILKIYNNE